ncbi:molybdenum cofactor guanylyltransferase MobA [Oceanibaculum indicum]|uniref:Molybdenum cofactor guanylyltransferase n=1 Tax=Oceanibaculum indicum P24 TaxID=1207063 RepID=K2JX13_9PROT|nr:molybdenum cofactor guanylyltransferase MobA [Oceanibaculum indicum]EKE74839.1 molybdopterin-guanine dinucleotide biosynthesis protein A [Oceanibaculum indicum P24]
MLPETGAEDSVVGLVLAGGLSRRMGGGDKCLLPLGDRTVLAHVLDRVRPQVSRAVLNANGDPARFAAYGLPVVPDIVDGFAGPLAGVLTGLDWAARNAPQAQWVASFAADTPFLPADLVPRMLEAVAGGKADMACAASGGRAHPVFGLWPVRLLDDLRDAVVVRGIRKVDAWTANYRVARVEFGIDDNIDPFFNANTPEDMEKASGLLNHLHLA